MSATPEEIEISEEHFRRLYEEAPLPYQSLDKEGRILAINRAWEETLGYTREEVLGHSIGEFHAPGQKLKLSQAFAEFIACGLVDRIKILFQCKDGTEKLFSINGRIAHDRQGHFLRTHCILTDITEHERIVQALRKSERRFALFMEHLPGAAFLKDADGQALFVNRYLKRHFNAENWLGRSTEEVFPGELGRSMRADDERALREGMLVREETVPLPDGRQRLFLSHKFRVPVDGEQPMLGGIAMDITDIQKIEEKLLRKNAELRTLLDAIPAPVYFMDHQLRYQSVNQAFLTFMDMSAEQVIGKTVTEIFLPDTATEFNSSNCEVIDDGRIIPDLEQAIPDPSGAIRWFSTTKTPVFEPDGTVTGLVGVSFEITEQKLAQERRLDEEKTHRETLVREVHHRIKNHLQGVIGLLHNLSQSGLPAEETLNKAISQIRSIATVYGLQSDTGGGRIKISELILASLNVYRNTRPAHIVLEVDEVCSMELNREESIPVALVINELITNAIKHASPPPGKQPVVIEFGTTDTGVRLRIRNHSKRLPESLDLDTAATLGTGLKIVRTLLPTKGAKLSLESKSGYVVAELLLEPPVIWSSRESQ